MRTDRSQDARKSPQQWSDKFIQRPRRGGGSWAWSVVGGTIVGVAFLGIIAFILVVGVQRQREEARRQQAVQDLQSLRDLFDRVPYNSPDVFETPPSVQEDWARPYSEEFRTAPSGGYDLKIGRDGSIEGTSNTLDLRALDQYRESLRDDDLTQRFDYRDWSPSKGWGHLRGRFVLAGERPDLRPLRIRAEGADGEFIRQCNPQNESLVTGPGRELANVVVFLSTPPPQSHPDYEKLQSAEVTLRIEKCRFDPRITLLRTQQRLKIVNADPITHQPHLYGAALPPPEPLEKGAAVVHRLSEADAKPKLVECDRHGFIRGWVVVRDNPYMAVTGADGTFEIKNLPAGVELEFTAWHELPGNLSMPEGDTGSGRFRCTITADQAHDLGQIELPPAFFVRKGKAPSR